MPMPGAMLMIPKGQAQYSSKELGQWGQWDAQSALENLNILELQAVFRALWCFLTVLKGQNALVHMDERATAYHTYHQGGTKFVQCLQVTQRLRGHSHTSWGSGPSMFLVCRTVLLLADTTLWWRWDSSQRWWKWFIVDLFASEATTHCPLWFFLMDSSQNGAEAAVGTPSGVSCLFIMSPILKIGRISAPALNLFVIWYCSLIRSTILLLLPFSSSSFKRKFQCCISNSYVYVYFRWKNSLRINMCVYTWLCVVCLPDWETVCFPVPYWANSDTFSVSDPTHPQLW